MIVKIKYLGGYVNFPETAALTINNSYVILDNGSLGPTGNAAIIDDNGDMYTIKGGMDDKAAWEVSSVTYTESVTVVIK